MSDFQSHESIIQETRLLPVMLTGKLIGREQALAAVYAGMKAGRPMLLHGVSGAGKTTLAATLSAAYIQQQNGAVLWMSVNHPKLEELLVRVGRAYGITELTSNANPVSMLGAVENTLKSKKPLIVLDGDIQPDAVSRFISRCAQGIPVIIATEQKLEGPWTPIELEPLDANDGAALFKREARLEVGEHDIDVFGISKLVGYLPLGIMIAARAMVASKQKPDGYIKLLQQIANASGGNSPIVALTASFRALTGPLQGLLLMMGAIFNGQASADLMSAMSGAPLESVQQALNILAQLQLVERILRYDAPYYQMHPMTYQFVQTWLRSSNRLESLQEKAQNAVVNYARTHAQDSPDAFQKLAAEIETFMATARWAEKQGDREVAGELVSALTAAGEFIEEGGYLYEQMELRALSTGAPTAFPAYEEELEETPPEDLLMFEDEEEEIDEEAETVHGEEDDLEATFISNVMEEDSAAVKVPVSASVDLSSKDVNRLRAALAQAKQAGDSAQQIDILKAIGDAQIEQDMDNQAIATFGELLTVYEALDDTKGVVETLDMLSALAVKTDNSSAAVLHAGRGVKLAAELADNDTKMHLLTTLGDAHQQLGESDSAIKEYLDALAIARNRDDAQNEAIVLYKLGFAQLDNNDTDVAVDTWEQALQLFKDQNKRDYEGRTLGGLGSAYGDLERWAEAVSFHTSALYIARETDNKDEEALQLSNLAYAALQNEQLGEAVLRYRQALHLAYESEDEDNIVSAIVDLARLLLRGKPFIDIANLLIDDATEYEPHDRDVIQLQERIENERLLAESLGIKQRPVHGTARNYASNAYRLLEE